MKKYLVFFLMTLFFWGCVEEIKLDTDELALGFPTPCFKSEAESCNGTIIPMPSDFMLAAVPAGTELNLPNTTPFTMSFTAEVDATTLEGNVIVLKDGVPLTENVTVGLNPNAKNTLVITPTDGKWKSGKYTIILLKGIKASNGDKFVETLAFYYGKEKNSLLDEEGNSTISALDKETATGLEGLRLSLKDGLDGLDVAGMKRETFLMLWPVTINNFMACFKSLEVVGCEQFPEAPVPSDFIMAYEADGSHHLNLPIDPDSSDSTKAMLTAINTLDGWGVTSPFVVNLSENLDNTTITPTSVMLLKLTAAAPTPVAVTVMWKADTRQLIVFPKNGDIWRQKSTYVLVLTDALKNTDGNTLVKSKIFSLGASKTTLLDADGKSLYATAISDEDAVALEGLRLGMAPLFEGMEAANIKRENISMMYTVTTQTVTDDLMGLSLHLNSAATPVDSNPTVGMSLPHSQIFGALQQAGIDDPNAYAQYFGYTGAIDLYRNISFFVMGSLSLANYLSNTTGAWDPEKIPSSPTVEDTNFYMTIPYVKDDMHPDYCEMPINGFPVVIFQHGLGGDKTHIFSMANKFAENCYVSIAIDAVKHGDRKEGTQSGENFFSGNLFASRDNLRQSVLDLIQLKTAVNKMADVNFALANLPESVRLDATKVSYFGISLGGILGTIFMAVSPDITTGVLNVPGGGLMDILMNTYPGLKQPLIDALAAQGLVEGTPEFAQFLFLGQLILDQGDPIAYAHHTITEPLMSDNFNYTAKNILMQKATDDEVIPNFTTDHLATVMGIISDTDHYKTYTPTGNFSNSKHSFIAGNEIEAQKAKDDVVNFYDAVFTGGN